MLIKPNKIINLINIILVIFIAYFSVQLSWLFLLDEDNIVIKNTDTNSNKNKIKKTVILKPIFGKAKKAKITTNKIANTNLATTKLNIKLKGIWLESADDSNKYALITINNKDKVYVIGDKISSLATIVNINIDHIIINRSGNLESLYLREKSENKASVRTNNKSTVKAIDPELSSNDITELQDIRKQLKTNPWRLSQIMKIHPYYKNNKLQGFKIRPGKKVRLFNRLKLRSGDIVYKINGDSLQFKNLNKVLNAVLTNNTIVIDIYRDKKALSLTLKL